jgi:hypothetical protein
MANIEDHHQQIHSTATNYQSASPKSVDFAAAVNQ